MFRCLLWVFAAAMRPRLLLIADNLCLRQQLLVLQRRKPRPRLTDSDRRLWILAYRWFVSWQTSLLIVKPETVLRWHRQGWRGYWRRRSSRRGKTGRPPIAPELRTLIRRMTMENRVDPGGVGAAGVQSLRENDSQVYASKPPSRALFPLAVIPEAACVGHLGVRLLLCPDHNV
jgi:hypothetical protein